MKIGLERFRATRPNEIVTFAGAKSATARVANSLRGARTSFPPSLSVSSTGPGQCGRPRIWRTDYDTALGWSSRGALFLPSRSADRLVRTPAQPPLGRRGLAAGEDGD